MPFKLSKRNPKLLVHYGKWTKADEDEFYNRLSFKDWKGSSGIIPHASIKTDTLNPNIEFNADSKSS